MANHAPFPVLAARMTRLVPSCNPEHELDHLLTHHTMDDLTKMPDDTLAQLIGTRVPGCICNLGNTESLRCPVHSLHRPSKGPSGDSF